jgi:hypothetical protein
MVTCDGGMGSDDGETVSVDEEMGSGDAGKASDGDHDREIDRGRHHYHDLPSHE